MAIIQQLEMNVQNVAQQLTVSPRQHSLTHTTLNIPVVTGCGCMVVPGSVESAEMQDTEYTFNAHNQMGMRVSGEPEGVKPAAPVDLSPPPSSEPSQMAQPAIRGISIGAGDYSYLTRCTKQHPLQGV